MCFPFAMLPSHPLLFKSSFSQRCPRCLLTQPSPAGSKLPFLGPAAALSLSLGHLLKLRAERHYLFTSGRIPPRVSVPSGQERGLLPFSPAPTELQGVSPRCLTNTHMGGVTDLTRSMVNGVCHRMYVYSSSRVLGRCLRLGRTSSRQAHSAQA